MNYFNNPSRDTWTALTARPQLSLDFLTSAVRNVMTRVKKSGDHALRELTKQYDHADIGEVAVSATELSEAAQRLPNDLKQAIQTAAANIEKFHAAQVRSSEKIETMPGVTCWRRTVAIDKVGIYIPGGTAPLFSSVLMLGIPARLAGCKEVILCSPPDKQGQINDAILYAAQLVGITRIFKAGGAQAIAAMTFGTGSIPRVHKIFGPGNQYVTKAKQLATEEGVAIDMPAGPSEVLLLGDDTINPRFAAADLLSQAEHGEDSQVMLVLVDESPLRPIQEELKKQLENLPRKQLAEKALANSRAIAFTSLDDAIDFVNEYAPEHLIINTRDADAVGNRITNAGSVFLGNYSPEAAGDYASGTNHTLPTNGFAKAYAGVSLESFTKVITYQSLTLEGLKNIGPVVERMAEAEALMAHKLAVRVRLESNSE